MSVNVPDGTSELFRGKSTAFPADIIQQGEVRLLVAEICIRWGKTRSLKKRD